MSLVITTNSDSDVTDRQERSIYSAYSYRNDIGSTYKIPPHSQVCLQSAKVNLDGRVAVGNSFYYDYFGKELDQEYLGTPKLEDTITYPILQDFGGRTILELTRDEFAAEIERTHREYHPNNKKEFNCAVKRNAGLDFEGYSFSYDQNLSSPDNNFPTSSKAWYSDLEAAKFSYNVGSGVFQRNNYAQDDNNPAVGILLGRPLSLAGGNRDFKCLITNANASGVTWAIGLSRDVPVPSNPASPDAPEDYYVPPYYESNLINGYYIDLEDQYFFADYCVHRDASGLLQLTHAVPTKVGNDYIFTREQVKYWTNASSAFAGAGPYNISTNASAITAVEFIPKGELMEVFLDAGGTKYLLTTYSTTSDKDSYCKPISQTCWCMHPILFVGASGGNLTSTLQVDCYAGINLGANYDSGVIHKGGWFESALLSEDDNWIKQCEEVDKRPILDPDDELNLYSPILLNASNGVDYKTTMIVMPNSTYNTPLANTADIFGFPNRGVINTGTVAGNLITFDSDTATSTDSVKSIFVRLNNYGNQVLNSLTRNKSTILAHLPTADSRYTNGGRIFYEPNRDVWLDLNNPFEISTSDFSIDLVYSNEQYAKVAQGQTIVILYFRRDPAFK